MTFPPHLLSHPDVQLYKDVAPPPGTEVHYARNVDGAFVLRIETLEGETDGQLLADILDYLARVEAKRSRRARITLVAD